MGSGSLLAFTLMLLTTMCVVSPVILFTISFLKPRTMLTVRSITLIPTVMPIIPIFTIGLEMLPLLLPESEMRSAINFSTLKLYYT